jgi:hypothetical protein
MRVCNLPMSDALISGDQSQPNQIGEVSYLLAKNFQTPSLQLMTTHLTEKIINYHALYLLPRQLGPCLPTGYG